jgi:hypothetical protein
MSWADENVYDPPDWVESLGFRNYIWKTKKGEFISIKDMDDSHLLNAFRLCRDVGMQEGMLKEMTYRLFEEKVKNGN